MKRKLRILLRYLAALLVALSILAPMTWLFLMSVSATLTPGTAGVAARQWGFSRYARLLSLQPGEPGALFLPALRNSLLVAAWSDAGVAAAGGACCLQLLALPRTRRLAVRRTRHLYGAAGGLRAAALFYSRTFRAAEYPQRAGAGLLFADYAVSHLDGEKISSTRAAAGY